MNKESFNAMLSIADCGLTFEQFQKQAINHAISGWNGEYCDYLLRKFNDCEQCRKIFDRCKRHSYRWCISIGDALHHFISHGKI